MVVIRFFFVVSLCYFILNTFVISYKKKKKILNVSMISKNNRIKIEHRTILLTKTKLDAMSLDDF